MAYILIIDDDPDMVLATRLCLEGGGHAVDSAGDPADGLKKIKARRPDLIILDVMMDSATAGFQLALQLRGPNPDPDLASFNKIPILMLTAIHSTTPLRFGPDDAYLPVDDFIDKPFEPEVLLKKVNALLTA
jgi:two-component system, OmpR family, alkaline phosphatase synthesis response regulator PhoP